MTSRFAAFSEHLVALLMSTLQSSASSLSQQRKRLWVNFFKLRSEKLLSLWRAFLQDISCSSAIREPLFMELVNESLLQKLCKNMIPTPQSDKSRLDTYLLKDEHAEHYKICLWLRRDETVQSICQAAWWESCKFCGVSRSHVSWWTHFISAGVHTKMGGSGQ